MRAYFLVAKDVGDLTRIFCAALEEQNRKRRPTLSRLLPGFLKPRAARRISSSRTAASMRATDAFRRDPVNLLRIFHVAETRVSTSIPRRCAPSRARST